jgi:uncharacterized protein YggT (Ycf19 family)
MARRVVVDDDRAVDSYSESSVVEHPSIASVIANVLTALYVAALGLIGLDALLEALNARESNGFVSAIDTLSGPLLAPFRGVFNNQQYWATALIAAVVYTIVYLVAMAVLRRDDGY